MSQELNGVFISYRRDDSRWLARALKNKLTYAIGEDRVFMDVDSIDPGVDFVDMIDDMVARVDVMIAIVGPKFLTAKDEDGARLIDNPANWVRLEIATALRRKIRVIPLLQQGAQLPKVDELPDDLKALARRNAIHIGELTFEADVDRIIASIQRFWDRGNVESKDDEPAQPLVSQSPTESSPIGKSQTPTHANRAAVTPKTSTTATEAGRPAWLVPFLVLGGMAALFAALWSSGVFSRPDNGSTAGKMPNSNASSTDKGDGTKSSTDGDADKEGSDKQKDGNDKSADSIKTDSQGSGESESASGEDKDATDTKEPTKGNNDDKDGSRENAIAATPTTKDAAPAQVEGMVWLKPGKFMNDSQEEVELTDGFYLGTHEITQQQYQLVMKDATGAGANQSKFNRGEGNAPVENLKYTDAELFCELLNEMKELPLDLKLELPKNFKFRLPTEEQWEYACRLSYGCSNGDSPDKRQIMKYEVCYVFDTDTNREQTFNKPEIVGSKQSPGETGLFDLLGNVQEWCHRGTGNSSSEVFARGGSYFENIDNFSIATRRPHPQSRQSRQIGFRVAAIKSK